MVYARKWRRRRNKRIGMRGGGANGGRGGGDGIVTLRFLMLMSEWCIFKISWEDWSWYVGDDVEEGDGPTCETSTSIIRGRWPSHTRTDARIHTRAHTRRQYTHVVFAVDGLFDFGGGCVFGCGCCVFGLDGTGRGALCTHIIGDRVLPLAGVGHARRYVGQQNYDGFDASGKNSARLGRLGVAVILQLEEPIPAGNHRGEWRQRVSAGGMASTGERGGDDWGGEHCLVFLSVALGIPV